jgi:hypothetical protein
MSHCEKRGMSAITTVLNFAFRSSDLDLFDAMGKRRAMAFVKILLGATQRNNGAPLESDVLSDLRMIR